MTTVVEHETLSSVNPVTGDVIATFPVQTTAEAEAAVGRARAAATWWGALGFAERRRRLLAVRGTIARRAGELTELVHAENGKPVYDAYIELVMGLDHLTFAATRAKQVLGRRRTPRTLLTLQHTAWVQYEPLGVVGVITPWNFPLVIPLADVAAALAAGNAVVLKPSEFTTAVGRWLVDRFAETVPEHAVVQLVSGFADTGQALCRSGVDKIAFTGSTANGRKVMTACAETLTPVTLELGGKDALVVDEDADLDRAADATAFGAFWNAGQSCVAIERAYVHDRVYDDFLDRVAARARGLSPGGDPQAAIGAMTTPAQVETVRRHVADALARGARVLVGSAEPLPGPFIDPIVLVDVPDDALVMTEETFGPVLPIVKVRDADEAVERANASRFGLGAGVFGKRRVAELATRLRAGACGINTVMFFYAHRRLPLGGVGASGFGSVHGPDGLRGFARPRSVLRQRLPLGRYALDRFDPDPRIRRLVARLPRVLYGRR
jgi:acyl-CoA reductase-like NAD-dependent aldehyde dehydrogenase